MRVAGHGEVLPRVAGQGQVPGVQAVAVLLGPDVRGGELADGRGEPADAGGVVRVPVGLARAAAEPAHLLDDRVQHEPQPDLGQRAGPAAVGRDV